MRRDFRDGIGQIPYPTVFVNLCKDELFLQQVIFSHLLVVRESLSDFIKASGIVRTPVIQNSAANSCSANSLVLLHPTLLIPLPFFTLTLVVNRAETLGGQ